MSKEVTIVDARMGRGKSSAAIRYMNKYKGEKRFLYITPYLDEVGRICEQCDFEQPCDDNRSKSTLLKSMLSSGKNVAATHALFYLMDDEALQLIKDKNYSLIIDESIEVISRCMITKKDADLVLEHMVDEDDDGVLHWRDPEYVGEFSYIKEEADAGFLRVLDGWLISVMRPELLTSFDEVFMLTYRSNGQFQKAYLEMFGFSYRIVGVERDEHGYYFSDKEDCPPPIDYSKLINIEKHRDMNRVGDGYYTLSKGWIQRRGYDDVDVKTLRNKMRCFLRGNSNGKRDGGDNTRMWTSYKEGRSKFVDKKTKRYNGDFLQIAARATNEYRHKTRLAYIGNRFMDPNLAKFFRRGGVAIDENEFALSEMLQWIWRSAIRDDKPIDLYVPSERMRKLLLDWIEEQKGGVSCAK